MDSTSQMARLKEGVGAAILTPNEARVEVGLLPIPGGDTVYMQQQNYSLAALAKRDQKDDPFATGSPPPLPDENAKKSVYQGIFKPDNQYEIGQFVTKNGSLWHVEKAHLGEFDHENFKLVQKKWGES